jgi:Flp pilus assembly protein TadG
LQGLLQGHRRIVQGHLSIAIAGGTMTPVLERGRRTETGGSSEIRGRRRRGRTGQRLAEFARIQPVFLLLSLTAIDFGTLARKAVRAARRRAPETQARTSDGGQSLVEFAIVLPVLLLLFLSILQIGFLLFTQVGLINAAREAARNASSIAVVNVNDGAPASATYYARLTDPASGFLKRNVGGYNASRLLVAPSTPHTSVCYYSFTDAGSSPAVMARVEVQYSHPLFVPLLSPILDGFDGSMDGGFRLSAVESIRVGNAVLTTTDIGDINNETCSP